MADSNWKAIISADTSQVKAELEKLKNTKISLKVDKASIQSELNAIFDKKYTLKVDVKNIGKDISNNVEKGVKSGQNTINKMIAKFDFSKNISKFNDKIESFGGSKNSNLSGIIDQYTELDKLQSKVFSLAKNNEKTGGVTFGDNVDEAAKYVARMKELIKSIQDGLSTVKENGDQFVKTGDIEKLQQEISKFKSSFKLSSADLSSIQSISGVLKTAMKDGNLTQKQFESLSNQFNETEKSAKQYQEINKFLSSGKGEVDLFKAQGKYLAYGGENNQSLSKAAEALKQYQEAYEDLASMGVKNSDGVFEFDDVEKAVNAYKTCKESLSELNNELQKVKASGNAFTKSSSVDRMSASISKFANQSSGEALTSLRQLQEEMNAIKSANGGITESQMLSINNAFAQIKSEAQGAGSEAKSFGSSMREAFLQATIGSVSLQSGLQTVKNSFREMYSNVKEIDSSMVELKKVTDETDKTYSSFVKSSGDIAKGLGVTTPEYITSTADFARLGYNFNDAQSLSKTASVYNTVGDDLSGIDQATQHIVSTMAAFGVEASDSISIVDKLNNVSNKYSISSGGLGEALTRSSSSMRAANNTLDQTIALITAANAVVQNPESVGTAFKTLSMRLRGAETKDIEEAGGDVDGMSMSISKLRDEMKNLAGIDIMKDDNTFKSTYDILKDLSNVWKDLSDIDQANILEQLAGKRQSNVLSALISNFDMAESALRDSMNSAGSAYAEHEKALDSVEAKENKVNVSMEQLSQTVMDVGAVKGGLDFTSGIIDGLNSIIKTFGLIPPVVTAASAAMSAFFDVGFIKKDAFGSLLNSFVGGNNVGGGFKNVKNSFNSLFSAKDFEISGADNQGIENETQYLANYVELIRSGESSADKFRQAMDGASDSTKIYAEANKTLYQTNTDGALDNAEANFRAHEEAKLYSKFLSGKESGNAIQKAKSMIKTYNENLSESPQIQKEFNDAINDSSKTMGSYIGKLNLLNDGKSGTDQVQATFKGYLKSMAGDGLKNLASTVGTGLLNGLISGGISLAVDAVGRGISHLVDQASNWRKYRNQELIAKGAEARSNLNNISPAYEAYKAEQVDYRAGISSSEEMTAATNNLISALGLEASEVDNLISKYGSLSAALNAAASEKTNVALGGLRQGIEGQVDELHSLMNGSFLGIQGSSTFQSPLSFGNGTKDQIETVRKAFEESEFASLNTRGTGNTIKSGYFNMDFSSASAAVKSWEDLSKIRQAYEEAYTSEELSKIGSYKSIVDKLDKSEVQVSQIKQDMLLNNNEKAQSIFNQKFDQSSLQKSAKTFEEIRDELTDSVWKDGKGNYEGFIFDGTREGLEDIFTDYLAQDQSMQDKYQDYLSKQQKATQQTARGLAEANGKWNVEDIFGKNKGDQYERIADDYINKSKELGDAYKDVLSGDMDTENIDKLKKDFPELSDIISKSGKDTTKASQEIKKAISDLDTDLIEKTNEKLRTASKDQAAALKGNLQDILRLNRLSNNFSHVDIDAEKESFDGLNTAITNANSSLGMTSEDVQMIRDRFAGMDTSNVFEYTTSGIKINRTELAKLNSELIKQNKLNNQNKLDSLMADYDNLTKILQKVSDPNLKLDILGERDSLVPLIQEAAEAAAQYDALTSAYNRWILSQKQGEHGDQQSQLASWKKTADEFAANGMFGSEQLRAYLDTIYQEDLSSASVDTIEQKYNQLSDTIAGTTFSMNDFLNDDTRTNVKNFVDMLGQLDDSFVQVGEDGKQIVSFDEDDLSEMTGMSVEEINSLIDAMQLFGDFRYEGPLDEFERIKTSAEKASEAVKNISSLGLDGFTLDLDAGITGKNNINDQIDQLSAALEQFRNEDGTINLSAEGAEEVQTMLEACLQAKQQLEQPSVMTIDTSQIGEAQPQVESLQTLWNQINEYNNKVQVGGDSSHAASQLQSTISNLNKQDLNLVPTIDKGKLDADLSNIEAAINAGVKIDNESISSVKDQLDSINASNVKISVDADTSNAQNKVDNVNRDPLTIETNANTKPAQSQVNSIRAKDLIIKVSANVSQAVNAINGIKGKTVDVVINTIKNVFGGGSSGGVKGSNAIHYKGSQEVNGTAHACGTVYGRGSAYARGNWGLKRSETALTGELGQELVVDPKSGSWYTVGDSGAEFVDLPSGAIVFNHKQTEELFKNGYVTSNGGRGKAYAYGSINISSASPKSKGSKSSGGSSSSSTDDKASEIDWINVALDRMKRLIDNIAKAANNAFTTLSKRMSATDDQINKTLSYIQLQQNALDTYTGKANSIGLADDIKQKVWDGSIEIASYDEDTQKLISDMQKYADAALDARDALVDLNEQMSELYKQKFDLVAEEYENDFQLVEHLVQSYDAGMENLEKRGLFGSKAYYDASIAAKESQQIGLQNKVNSLIDQLTDAVGSGAIEEYSAEWYNMQFEINDTRLKIKELGNDIIDLNNKIRQLDWDTFDFALERIDSLCSEAEFLQDLLAFKDLTDEENGGLTQYGEATLGLMGQQFNILMRQADEYREEAEKAEAAMSSAPYDQELIKRREDMLKKQQQSILAAEEQKKAMIDLVQKGYDAELDAIKKLTDEYSNNLDAQKDLYDYQKKVKKQSDEIAALEKQKLAYQGDDSEEAKAKIQEIIVNLRDAKDDLEETEFDHAISEQKKMLDDLYDQYEQLINERMDEQDILIQDLIDQANMNASDINVTLNEEADRVGYHISDSMENCWDVGVGEISNVISNYDNGFMNQWTTTNSALNEIKSYVSAMRSYSDSQAGRDITSTNNVTHVQKPVTPQAPAQQPEQPKQEEKPVGIGSTIRVDPNEPIWADGQGHAGQWGTHQYFSNDPVYVITGESSGYYLVRWHGASANTGWFKKSAVKAFKSGGLADFTGLAQLDGTPSRPEYVLNSKDTENFFALTEALRSITMNKGKTGVSVDGMYGSNVSVGDIQTTVNIQHVEDFDDLCRKMQDSVKFDEMIREMTLGRLNGNNSLSKHRVKF